MEIMRRFIIAMLIVLGIYFAWAFYGRGVRSQPDYRLITKFQTMNSPSGKANIVALHPYMTTLDYSGASAFYNKLDYYFTEIKKAGILRGNTTVLLPEHFGTWLVAAEEKKAVYEASTIESAIRTIAISNIFQYLYFYFKSESENRGRETIFKMKANKMANIYQYAFSRIAAKFEVHIVAGSIILPDPQVVDGSLTIGNGPLKNVSVIFTPDGSVLPQVTSKKFPTVIELEFIIGGTQKVPVYDLPAGPTSILICQDAWHQQIHDQVTLDGAEIVLTPAYLYGNEIWSAPWAGLSSLPDEIGSDTVSMSEGDAWHKYSLSRFKNGTAISVFMGGQLWNLSTDGKSFVNVKEGIREAPDQEPPFVLNTWIY